MRFKMGIRNKAVRYQGNLTRQRAALVNSSRRPFRPSFIATNKMAIKLGLPPGSPNKICSAVGP